MEDSNRKQTSQSPWENKYRPGPRTAKLRTPGNEKQEVSNCRIQSRLTRITQSCQPDMNFVYRTQQKIEEQALIQERVDDR